MDIKNEMVKRLRQDCETLINVKIPKALANISDEKGANTYRNLTKALADNIKLFEEYEKPEWKAMWSIYETGANGENLTPQVAVWMQNENGEISNHQAFDIDYKLKGNTINGICNVNFEKNDNDKTDDGVSIELISNKKIFTTGETLQVNNVDYTVIKIINKLNKHEYSLLRTDEWNRHLKAKLV